MPVLARLVVPVCLLGVVSIATAKPPVQRQREITEEKNRTTVLKVDAVENCLFMPVSQEAKDIAARISLKPGQQYSVSVSGEAFLSAHKGRQADPMPGVVLFYCTGGPDGYETKYQVVKSGETIRFRTPNTRRKKDVFLSAFFIDYWPKSKNRGEYQLTISEEDDAVKPPTADSSVATVSYLSDLLPVQDSSYGVNLTFGDDPGKDSYDGAIGEPSDTWNLISTGVRESIGLRLTNGVQDDVTAEIAAHDGGWGIKGHSGIFHGYIYHNCQCVDLSVTLKYLPQGNYEVLVYAHGDAPNQNAAIVIESAGVTYSGRSTLNDGSWDFQNTKLSEGNQYVRYVIEVGADTPVVITSKRDGSNYSMFNAVQVVPWPSRLAVEGDGKATPQRQVMP